MASKRAITPFFNVLLFINLSNYTNDSGGNSVAWIGLDDVDGDGTWRWDDGTYPHWAKWERKGKCEFLFYYNVTLL